MDVNRFSGGFSLLRRRWDAGGILSSRAGRMIDRLGRREAASGLKVLFNLFTLR
jgi:hypothetical protein